MNGKKILIVATGYPKSRKDMSNIYLHRFAIALREKGLIVHVIAPHATDVVKEDLIDEIHIHRFQYTLPKKYQSLAYGPGLSYNINSLSGKIQLIPFILVMAWSIIKNARKYDIDIINAHWAIPAGFLAVITKFIHNTPTIIRIYGAELYPFIKRDSIIDEMIHKIIRYTLIHSDCVIANSEITANIGKLICERNDIISLPDGVDIKNFNPNIDCQELELNYKKDVHFIILSTGHMIERKGFIYLIESLPIVLERIPNAILIIGGDGPEKKNLVKKVEELELQGHVTFPGFINNEDLPKYMKMSDVFVLPSIIDKNGDTEGLGLVLIEAMACDTAVIGTNVGGIINIINNGVNGILVPEKSPNELANSIIKLALDEDFSKKIRENGLNTVEEKFLWDNMANIFISISEALIKRGE